MLFNSFPYIFVFLPFSVIIYFFLNKFNESIGKYWLVFASLVFYGFGAITYLPLLLLSIVINYTINIALKASMDKKSLKQFSPKFFLVIGIIFNICLLGIFKYADFFIANINLVGNFEISFLRLAIPLAISFYTFQQISYLVDTYHGKIKNADFLDYSIFVTFFPRILMGPITRYNELMPQFQVAEQKKVDYQNLSIGIYIFFIGLCKRIVIADTFGIYADLGYASTQSISFVEAWIISLSYTFQIYFDFSGYTDMAIGTAYFFNIKLPVNFNSPYLAANIQEFWRNWHITLSRFLRDYIYIPLGGNRKGNFSTYINIMITFLIGGLWHGAGWTFIIWGGIHGVSLCIQRYWQRFKIRIPNILAIFITFNVVNIAWVFFRAKNLKDAINILKAMFNVNTFFELSTFSTVPKLDLIITSFIAIGSLFAVFAFSNSNVIANRFKPSASKVAAIVLLIIIGFLFLNSTVPKEFIYNDF
jgi:D-alanyl-lipoteichoic acid acyltransferase DltB (MBOAT superfamily)